jgi:DNA-binding transcriptional ArsR family regulator
VARRRRENLSLSKAIARAFGHPLRVAILEKLSRGPATAGEIQAAVEVKARARLDYHLTILRDLQLVELVEARPENGQVESLYRASYGLARFGS